MIVDFQAETTPNDVVTVIATEALTENEDWNHYEPGQWAFGVAANALLAATPDCR